MLKPQEENACLSRFPEGLQVRMIPGKGIHSSSVEDRQEVGGNAKSVLSAPLLQSSPGVASPLALALPLTLPLIQDEVGLIFTGQVP